MKYAYEDLSDGQFETLIVLICQKLLGISTQPFCPGPDGGRDAKFLGKAERHPSTADPWVGTVIIQAKHTNGYNRQFAETDFFNPEAKKSVLGEEIPRIKNLRSRGQLDHYMLFANRRLSGNAESEIRAYLSKECEIPEPSIYLCGVEQLELLLKWFPEVPRIANLDPLDSPLIVSPDELAMVVTALARNKAAVLDSMLHPPTERVTYEQKNEDNNMTPDYAKSVRKRYLPDTGQIKTFLAAPENAEILASYEVAVEEFQSKIIGHRKEYHTFDLVMEYIVDLLFARDPILRQKGHKRLTRALVFYMYWNCDIGESRDAETE